MAIKRDRVSKRYHIDMQYSDWPRLRRTLGTTVKREAEALAKIVEGVRSARRRDIYDLIVAGKLTVGDCEQRRLADGREYRDVPLAVLLPPAECEIGPLVDEWLQIMEEHGIVSPITGREIAESTIARYKGSLDRLMEHLPEGRKTMVTTLTEAHLTALRGKRRAEGVKAGINRDFGALSSFLRWCRTDKMPHLRKLSFSGVREKEELKELKLLKPGDLTRLLQYDSTYRPLWALLALTGLRIGEALALTKRHVQLKADNGAGATVTVSGTDHLRGRVKTTCSERTVNVMVVDLFRHCVEPVLDNLPSPEDRLFRGPSFDYHAVQRAFSRAVIELGYYREVDVKSRANSDEHQSTRRAQMALYKRKVATLRLHDLRHTFAVTMHNAKFGFETIRVALGHGSYKMLQRYLQHIEAAAVDAVAAQEFKKQMMGSA